MCTVLFAGGSKVLSRLLWKLYQFDIAFKNCFNKVCTNDIFIIVCVNVCFVICVNWRVVTFFHVKLSLAGVSLCIWVLKLGLVLWVFAVINVWKKEKEKPLTFFNKGLLDCFIAFSNTNGSFKTYINADVCACVNVNMF